MKLSKQMEDKIKRLWELNNEASELDLEIRQWLEENNLIDNDGGDGINGFSLDTFIDVCEYGTGNPQEVIDMIKNI